MARAGPSSSSRPWTETALRVLLVPLAFVLVALFPYYVFTQAGPRALPFMAIALAVLALASLIGVWRNAAWAPWTALLLVAFAFVVALFAWSAGIDVRFILVALAALGAVKLLVFVIAAPATAQVTTHQRALFAAVLVFAGWVAVWGLFFPTEIARALPIAAPPLHARILGAMYLSGAVFMVLGILAREWSEVRVLIIILAVWTGMLGLVSALNLAAFNWGRGPAWFWFIAYVGFPLLAFWVAWCQRRVRDHPGGPVLRRGVRMFLAGEGAVATALGLALLFAPRGMVALWPWAIPPLLAHIYSAPFLAYGLGSLYAATQPTWTEVRIPVLGTLVFALAVLVASWLHLNLFHFATPSAWIWFGGFGIVSVALLAFAAAPAVRENP
jgi:hypothetical protein